MDKFFRHQLYHWTLNKIKANPQKFGADNGNSLITLEYLQELYPKHLVNRLDYRIMKAVSTVSRLRNKILLKHIYLDYRKKYKSKKRKKILL